MTLAELVQMVDKTYPDGLVARVHEGEDVGDTLALFIVRELADTHDPDASDTEQAAGACRALGIAINELQAVCDALVSPSQQKPAGAPQPEGCMEGGQR